MRKLLISFALIIGSLSNFSLASDDFGTPLCDSYLLGENTPDAVGVTRVESLMGRQTKIIDVSYSVTERRSTTDKNLRVINLGEVFSEGRVFMGFGRPNVYIGIPGIVNRGLGYMKVDAKSLKRADTKLAKTYDRVQSGLLLVFKDLSPEAAEQILQAAKAHEGTRRWTCVNANCHILNDAGFTIGGESLTKYFFPVALFRDILQYGLEYNGEAVEFDIVKTTPGYLEDIGLSISHSVRNTLCRHAERSCESVKSKIEKNAFLVKIKKGLKSQLGLAIFKDKEEIGPIEKPVWESQITRVMVPKEDEINYALDVSEPSGFGTLLRLIWGPHSLFEIPIENDVVDSFLPNKLTAYPDENPSFSTRMKKNILFNPGVIKFIRSQLSKDYRRVDGMTQNTLFDMLRTHSDDHQNKYNFVLTGGRLIIMKLDIGYGAVDWVMSKHVLMSNYSSDVRIAGEIWKTADGTIHFNINSGTYKPSEALLPKALALFNKLFRGVKVEALR